MRLRPKVGLGKDASQARLVGSGKDASQARLVG